MTERITGQAIRDLQHLLLVHDDAVGLLEDLLQFRKIVGDSLAAVLALNEVFHHAALQRAGAVECVERAQISDARGLVLAQNVAHTGRFKLEHAAGVGLRENFVRLGVVKREIVERGLRAGMRGDQVERVLDDVERGEAQEVHLEKRQLFETHHVVLGDDFIFVRFVEWNKILQRNRRVDDARGVHGAVARHAFEFLRHLQDLPHAGIFARRILEAGLLLDGVFELDVEDVRDQFRDFVDVGVGHVEHAAHVLDGLPRGERTKGDDLGHLLAAVLLSDVLDHLATAPGVEIDIDIRHEDTLRVEEALEEEAVFERIEIGNLHGVADQAAGGGATARSDGDAALFGEANEVPDDEQVTRELRLLDDSNLAVQAVGVLGEIVFQRARCTQSLQARPAFFEALAGNVFEIRVNRMLGRHIEFWKRLLDLFELHLAALRDLPGQVERIFEFAEQGCHFGARLEIELGLLEAHAAAVAHGLAGLNAQHDLVRAGVVLAHIVRVVGGDQRDTGLFRQAAQVRDHNAVRVEPVILDLEEEVAAAEQVGVLVGEFAGVVVALGDQCLIDVAAQAGRQRDQAFGVSCEKVFIDARFVIEAVEEAGGDERGEVAVAFLVLAEEDEVIVAIRVAASLVALLRDVDLASDDRVDPLILSGVVKLDRAEEVAMVGHGDGGHFLLDYEVHELGDFAGPVEEGIIGVAMQVDEGCHVTYSAGGGSSIVDRSGFWVRGSDSWCVKRAAVQKLKLSMFARVKMKGAPRITSLPRTSILPRRPAATEVSPRFNVLLTSALPT